MAFDGSLLYFIKFSAAELSSTLYLTKRSAGDSTMRLFFQHKSQISATFGVTFAYVKVLLLGYFLKQQAALTE